MKLDRMPEAQRKRTVREMNLTAFFSAARQHADTAQHLGILIEDEEVAAWRTAADPRRATRPRERIGHRTARDRHVGVIVVQDMQGCAAPCAQRGGETFGERLGAEDAAVEQQGIRHGQGVVVRGPCCA
jgi:hypothetical protein